MSPDTGNDKKEACLRLGATKWIDFRESKDLVVDVVTACDGLGPHAALIISPVVSAVQHVNSTKLLNVLQGAVYDQAVKYVRPNGTVVAVAIPPVTYTMQTPFVFIIAKAGHLSGVYHERRSMTLILSVFISRARS